TAIAMTAQKLWEIFFVDRDSALPQRADSGLVIVHADYVVSDLCKTSGRNKTDVPRTDNCYRDRLTLQIFHWHFSPFEVLEELTDLFPALLNALERLSIQRPDFFPGIQVHASTTSAAGRS